MGLIDDALTLRHTGLSACMGRSIIHCSLGKSQQAYAVSGRLTFKIRVLPRSERIFPQIPEE